MTKIDIISGFLGAGKTTLIKKLIAEAFQGEKLVLIENEFGEIGIDGGFLKDAGIQITEMNSGCICCSLVGDFGEALKKVLTQFQPDRILIEPSGVGKLSDVIRAVQGVQAQTPVALNSFVTVVDAGKCRLYMKNFGEFFNNQVESANTIILSRTQNVTQDKLETAVSMLREHNAKAAVITTPWDSLTGAQIREAMEKGHGLADEMLRELAEEHRHEHVHKESDDGCGCGCHDGQEHSHHEHRRAHDHGDHDHGEHDHDRHHDHGEHDHDHPHDHGCTCGCHERHHDHGHHHADDVFTSWGAETAHKYERAELEALL